MEEPRIDIGEEIGEDFYEEIEAPKFVDLTAPDRHRTEHDDRYWFCLRVGCDQKHEEEMDSEAIYKNFVLRVMAARSPNIRFRKALCRKETSAKMKCPQTVPPKTSRSRLSRLAMISSISRKVIAAKAKDKPVLKQNSTPNVKTKQPSVPSKALTTPRNKKRVSNPGVFRSVRNPKATTVEVPKNRVVAKALVFHSPKKMVKLKKSVELGHSIRKLCTGMNKLEITNGKKDALPLDASRKKMRGREVKSRVFDSFHPQNQKGREGPSKQMKMRNHKENELELPKDPASNQETEGDSNQLNTEEKLKDKSADLVSASVTSKSCGGNKSEEHLNAMETSEEHGRDKIEVLSNTSKSDLTSLSNSEERNASDSDASKFQLPNEEGNHDAVLEGSSHDGEIMSDLKDKEISEAMENDGIENAASIGGSNKATGIDDKENSLFSDENRKLNHTSGTLVERNVASKKETIKSTQKVDKEMNKASKEISTCSVKHRKPKPTNPKPFRLRTDERKILKEANLEKKQVLAPLREVTTSSGFIGGKSQKKHQTTLQRDETEDANCANDESGIGTPKNQPQQLSCSSKSKFKATGERKFSSSVLRCTISAQQKTKLVSSRVDYGQNKAAQNLNGSLKKPKSPLKKRLANPRGTASSRKKAVSLVKPGQLGTIKETSPTILTPKEEAPKPISDGAFLSTKSPAPGSGKSPQVRRPATVPKEPNFHSIHVPKSCTRNQIPTLPTVL